MRKTLFLTGALALVASALPAQTVRWNDRPTATWAEEAPRVRVYIEGRQASYGAPMRVRFEVSENAYVTVVRVDGNGRMTILFPYSRNQRAAARGGQVHYLRNPRAGTTNTAFYANDRMSGYVFALASYAPLDFSRFENRDYDRVGGWSAFTLANRNIARRPDVFIDRFAAQVLWDTDTPYDYDVDYYFPGGYQPSILNTYALCASMFDEFGAHTFGYGGRLWDWDTNEFAGYPYRSMCRSWYMNARCLSHLALFNYSNCNNTIIAQNPTTPTQPGDSTVVPIEPPGGNGPQFVPKDGVVRGGLFAPTPVPIIPGGPEPPLVERAAGRFDQIGGAEDLSGITSIPPRATRKMKEEDLRRASGGTSPSRTTFGGDASAKPQKTGTAVADAPERVQPPSREPTKSKATGEPRRETGSKAGFGSNTGRTSEPRSSGVDRVNNAPKTSAGTGSAANPPSIKSAPTVEKKKPPQD